MELIEGIRYNYSGLKLGLKTPSLLALGLLRFGVILILSIAAAWIVLANHSEIMSLIWQRPESLWIVWMWYAVSWLMSALLAGISAMLAFLLSQVLFSVFVMDAMSRITEKKITGRLSATDGGSWFRSFVFLIRQEIPRAVLPVVIALGLMVAGWLTPFSPISTVVSSLAAAVFLAWDNTDLVPARRLMAFGERIIFLRRHLGFHLGFGLCFLIPGLNIVLLSFAPVGGTLYYLEHSDSARTNG